MLDRDLIPNYLSASSPRGLRRLMLKRSSLKGRFYKFTDIQFVDGKWYAWYVDGIDLNDELMTTEDEDAVEL